MDVLKLLDLVEDIIEEGSSIPFSSKVCIDKDEILDITNEIRLKLPDEIKQAEWIKEERQRILAEAQSEADTITEEARLRIEEMIEEDLGGQPPELQTGLTHPRHMYFCLGHQKQEDKLLELFNAGRMPHALILSGSRGIGKSTFAFRLARFILKQTVRDPNQNAMFDDEPAGTKSFDLPADDIVFQKVDDPVHSS